MKKERKEGRKKERKRRISRVSWMIYVNEDARLHFQAKKELLRIFIASSPSCVSAANPLAAEAPGCSGCEPFPCNNVSGMANICLHPCAIDRHSCKCCSSRHT